MSCSATSRRTIRRAAAEDVRVRHNRLDRWAARRGGAIPWQAIRRYVR